MLFFILMISLSQNTLAWDACVNGIYYHLYGQQATVTYGHIDGTSSYRGDLVIPSSFIYNNKTYTVIRIGVEAFVNCKSLSSITIPNTISKIDNSAFKGCSSLKKVVLSDGSSTCCIGTVASTTGMFKDCPLDTVYIGRNISYNTNYPPFSYTTVKFVEFGEIISQIDENSFKSCYQLENVSFPSSLISIKEDAFYSCFSLKSVEIPEMVTTIGNNAFCNCKRVTSLTWNAINCTTTGQLLTDSIKQVVIGNTVEVLPSGFCQNAKITSVRIPKSVKTIGMFSFSGCSNLNKVEITDLAAWCNIDFSSSSNPLSLAHHLFLNGVEITNLSIPNSITQIKDNTFYNFIALKSVTFSNSVTYIGADSFANCSGLNNVTFSKSLKSIDVRAFQNCTGLTSLTIPENLEIISVNAFDGCNGLTSLTWNAKDCYSNGNMTTQNITSAIIGNNVLSLPKGFLKGSKITSISIPSSVNRIGQNAFSDCLGLTSVVIPNGVESFGSSVFSSCDNLSKIVLPNSLINPGDYTFSNCSKLVDVTLPDSVSSLGGHMFANCLSLKSIAIPRTKRVGVKAFDGCSGLIGVDIPNSVEQIGYGAFDGCVGLQRVNIYDLTSWCRISFITDHYDPLPSDPLWLTASYPTLFSSNPLFYAHHLFLNGKEVSELEIPDNVNQILDCAFYNCIGITSLKMPNSVYSIGNYAFKGCSGLKKAIISGSVSSIGKDAFAECTEISKLFVLRDQPPSVTEQLFPNNQLIYVPNREKYIINSNWKNYNIIGIYTIDPSLTRISISSPGDFKLKSASLYQENEIWKPFNAENNTVIISDLMPKTPYLIGSINVIIDGENYSFFEDIITTLPIVFGTLQSSSTQTTLNTSFTVNRDEGFVLDACGLEGSSNASGSITYTTSDSYTIGTKVSGLSPSSSYYFKPWVCYKGVTYYGYGQTLYTSAIGVSCDGTVGPTTVDFTACCSSGDAHVTKAYFTFQNKQKEQLRETGLDPKKSYSYTYTVETSNGSQSNSYSFTTPALSMVTQVPRMLQNTMPMLMAETNMADIETSCGFEWRRYDAPEEMPSAKVYCPVYGGVMAGTLKNMSENVYYKYRPFYKSSAGNEYYGDWIAFITADAGVEFEPVVYTYDSPAVTQTDATLQGVAIRGSEEITEQGFEYWKTNRTNMLTASNDVTRVTARGERMSKTVSGLQAGTKYTFRAYVIAGGETTYGEEVQFVTLSSSLDVNVDGEINIADVNTVIGMILESGGGNIGDVNGDGEVNIADINTLIDAILSK